MSEEAAFHEAMKNPHDHLARRVYADWLDEHGRPEAAASLRWLADFHEHSGADTLPRTGRLEDHDHYNRIPLGIQQAVALHDRRATLIDQGAIAGGDPNGERFHQAMLDHLSNVELRNLGRLEMPAPHTRDSEFHPHTVAENGINHRERHLRDDLWRRVAKFAETHPYPDHMQMTPKKLARVQAPAGGAIVGGGLQTGGIAAGGGQFMGKAHARIRKTVLAWLQKKVKLAAGKAIPAAYQRNIDAKRAREKAAGNGGKGSDLTKDDLRLGTTLDLPTPPPSRPGSIVGAIHAAKAAIGPKGHGAFLPLEHARGMLTVRELKHAENLLGLPAKHRLSNKHGNEKKLDDEHINPISLDQYYHWSNGVTRHLQKEHLTKAQVAKLQDSNVISRAKLAYMGDHLGHEAKLANALFADTGGASGWYGDHVAAMARHLHDQFHSGDKADDALWGKVDKKSGRVKYDPTGKTPDPAGITIAKLLVAATSGGQKPHDNYDTAHEMMQQGRKHAKGSPDIFATIPHDQGDDLRQWVDAAAEWHKEHGTGVTREDILTPGLDLKDRALWYEKVVRPMEGRDAKGNLSGLSNGGTNSQARYSGMQVNVVRAPGNPHHGAPIAINKGKDGWKNPYGHESMAFPPLEKGKHSIKAPAGYDSYADFLAGEFGPKDQTRNVKLPAVDNKGRLSAPGWTSRNEQVMDGVHKINLVIKHFKQEAGGDARKGLVAAAHFFLNPQHPEKFDALIRSAAGLDKIKDGPTLEELRKAKKASEVTAWIKKVAALNSHFNTGVSEHDVRTAARLDIARQDNAGFFFPDDHLPGAFVLGPKFGAFASNLHLDVPRGPEWDKRRETFGQHLTADLWWTRTWNTMLGTLFDADNSKTKRREVPRGKGDSHPERKLMRKAAQIAVKQAGLSNIAELQAVLWYYEQHKPEWFGVNTSSTSYLDGVNTVAKRDEHGRKKYHVHPTTGAIHVSDRPAAEATGTAGD